MKKLLLDAGHGWETLGKESIFHMLLYNGVKKAQLKENCFNEAVCNKISMKLGDKCSFITPEWYDITLEDRMRREHALYIKDETMFLSVHSDAFTKKDTADGATFFYYSEQGKMIAEYFTQYLAANGYGLNMRNPKQANFYVLKNSLSPAILFEAGFMTTESDLIQLNSDTFRNKTAQLLSDAFLSMKI